MGALTKIQSAMVDGWPSGSGSIGKKVDIVTLGADPTGSVDIAPIIQDCRDNGLLPVISGGTFLWNTQVNVPEGVNSGIYSDPSATIITTQSITLLSCVRTTPSLASRTTFHLVDCKFHQTGTVGTGIVFRMQGIDVTWDDNVLFVRGNNSMFRGFYHAIEVRNASTRVYDAYFVFNTVGLFLEFNASFLWFQDLLFLVNDYAIYGDSGSYDGITNSIHIGGCTAVNSRKTDYWFSGWDAISIFGGGCDLGGPNDPDNGVGAFALRFFRCSNINLQNTYISSDLAYAPNRTGVALIDCSKAIIHGSRIQTNKVGIFVQTSLGLPAGHIISENFLAGNTQNHIWLDAAIAVTIAGNKLDNTPNRVGGNYEVSLSGANNTYLNMRQNDFEGTEFSFGASQTGSVVESQRWGVPLV